jgi:hypothetical protein
MIFLTKKKQQAANCLLTELKLYKDKKIDKEGIAKFIGDSIKDDAWKSAAKETSEYCVKEIEKRKVELIKEYKEEPYGIKEEDCDVVPWVLLSCFIIQSDNVGTYNFLINLLKIINKLQKCPKEHRNPSDDCKYNYDFIEKCSNKTDIFSEIKEGMKSLNDQL